MATLYRWGQRGLSGVRLEAISVGGTVCTSREALQRFVERLCAARGLPDAQPAPRTSRQRERAVEQAEKELEAAGI